MITWLSVKSLGALKRATEETLLTNWWEIVGSAARCWFNQPFQMKGHQIAKYG